MSPTKIMPPPTTNQPVVLPARNAHATGSFRRPYSPDGTIHHLRAVETDAARYVPPGDLEEMGFSPHDIAVLDRLPLWLRDAMIEQFRAEREANP